MRKVWLILLWVLTACFAGCQQDPMPSRTAETGSLRVSLNPLQAELETRAPEQTPQEGYSFENLLVVLTNDHGKVIDKVYRTYSTNAQRDDIEFQNLEVGTYHAYAYANIGHAAWQRSGETIAEVEKVLQTEKQNNANVTLNTDRTLVDMASGTAPAMPTATPMLLTGEATVPVTVNDNEVGLDLLRPVTRLNVRVSNHTPFPLKITELQFNKFNVTKSYLLAHRNAAGAPVLPAGTQYVDLPALSGAVTVPADDGSGTDEGHTVYSTLLYENAAGEYKMSFKVELQSAELAYPTKLLGRYVYNATLLTSTQVLAMQAGEEKTVMLVNPQNNSNGCMFGWDNTTGMLFKRSPQIKAMADFQTWVGSQAGQDGIEKYFLTLRRRADGKFEVLGGTHNLFDNLPYLKTDNKTEVATGTDAMTAVAVASNYSRSQIDKAFNPYLVRFYCNTPTTESLDAYLWNNSSTQLRTKANDSANQACQWVMYEVDASIDGVILKYIDNTSHKEKALTVMPRNKDFTVDVDVYYEAFETQFNFRVENTWWKDAGAHVSSHIFN